ncbi:MAG: hypothetical protein LBF88_13560 [Planctomycetaceae bacterium]|jgi:hypothetical protein|nr:hypothetical protein [Planctomycetaceae bacterium]
MYKCRKYFVIVFVGLFLVCGCGRNHVSLSGKVTFSDDGSPVPKGTIVFVKESFQATAAIQPDGNYVAGSFSAKDGLPAGNYAVWLFGVTEILQGEAERSLIDSKYESAETSGLTVNVDASTKTYNLKLDRNSNKK